VELSSIREATTPQPAARPILRYMERMDITQSPGRDALERMARELSSAWPHYWRMRERTREQLLEHSAGTETRPEGSLALKLTFLGVQLIAVARRAVAAAELDVAAAEAASYLMSLAEEYYLYLGLLARADDRTFFDWHAASAVSRDQAEAFVRDVGIADWCADAGHALVDASGAVIRLGCDHVPAPTIEAPVLRRRLPNADRAQRPRRRSR
jgi:hypothetical protein